MNMEFRVWDKHCKYFIHFGEKYWFNDSENTITFQCDNKVMGDRDDGKRFVFQQFTGLKDKNDKKIFKEDVLRLSSKEDRGNKSELIGSVDFENGAFCGRYIREENKSVSAIISEGMFGERKKGEWFNLSKAAEDKDIEIEIIGNTKENPELLKEG